MKYIIGSNQHNEIYSDKCGVLVSGKVSEEITYLFDKVKNLEAENAKLKVLLKDISHNGVDYELATRLEEFGIK